MNEEITVAGRFTIVERSGDTLKVTRTFPHLEFTYASKAIEFVRFAERTGIAKPGKRYFIKSMTGNRRGNGQ